MGTHAGSRWGWRLTLAMMWLLGGYVQSQEVNWGDSLAVDAWADSLLERVENEPDFVFVPLITQQQEMGVPPKAAFQLWCALGEYYQLLYIPDSSLYAYEQAAALAEATWGNPSHALSNAYNGLGIAHYIGRRREEAVAYARKTLHIREQVLPADHTDLAQAHNNLGLNLFRVSKFDSALYHMEQAISVWEKMDSVNLADLLAAYNNMGILTSNLGDDRAAIDWYKRVLAYKDQIPPTGQPHQISISAIYNNLGICYQRIGDSRRGLSYARQSISLDLTDTVSTHITGGIDTKLDNLAKAYLRMGMTDSARACVHQGIAIKRQKPQKSNLPLVDSYLILAHAALMDEQAEDALGILREQEAAILDEYGDKHARYSTWTNFMGEAHLAVGDTLEARKWLSASLEQRKALYPPGHGTIIGQAVALSQSWGAEEADVALNVLLDVAPPDSILRGKGTFLSPNYVGFWGEVGRRYRESGQLPASAQAYQRALDYLRAIRRSIQLSGSEQMLLANARPVLAGAMQTDWLRYAQTGDTQFVQHAFTLGEESRSILLREALQGLRAQSFTGLPEALKQEELRLRRQLVRLDRRISRAESRAPTRLPELREQRLDLLAQQDALLARLEQAYPAYYELRFDLQGPDLADLQQVLGARNQDLLALFWEKEAAFAYVMRPDTLIAIPLVPSPELEAHITGLQTALENPASTQPEESRRAFVQHARALYAQLMAPIVAQVPDLREQIVVVPDGKLGYVPFHLLLSDQRPDEPTQADDWSTLPYLMRSHVISYAYSARLIDPDGWSGNQPGQRLMLALAPDFAAGQAKLAYNQEEARQVVDRISGELWLGTEALEAAFKEKGSLFRLLHIASHASLDDQVPLYSYIQLVASGEEDGRLEIAELFGLRLPADLVVLGACETGRGAYQRGEGILSLAWGFSYAGVRSVLTTLWPVNDRTSADMMDQFYAELLRGGTRAAALQKAQLHMLEQGDPLTAHPYYWGGFQLIGETGPIPLPSPYTGKWGAILGGLALLTLMGILWYRNRRRALATRG